VAAEGMILTEYNAAVHLVDSFVPPSDWVHYWTVDFGVVHPFVWQDWVADPDGRLFMVREIYMTGKTVEDHCRTIKRVTNGQPRPQMLVTDHQAQERIIMER